MPYRWDPDVIPISIFRVGQLFILNIPAEFTTMAGRRVRKAVRKVLMMNGVVQDPVITIAGLANSYAHYVTTFEEYGGQRYEAASTLYGPHTLAAYIQEFRRIASDMINGLISETTIGPRDLSGKQITFIPSIHFDTIGIGKSFGSVAIDANEQYKVSETVAVSFRSANPRNNQRIDGSFLTVDVLDDNGVWQTRYVDSDWCTQFHWKGGIAFWGASFAEIFWKIPDETPRGLYRICHFGTRKTVLGDVEMALYRAPVWFPLSAFGSYAVNLAVQSVKLVVHLSGLARLSISKLALSRTKDFHGCSRTFLVH